MAKIRKRKNKPLVTQFLENVSLKAIKECSAVLNGYANKRHGIYALYKKNRLYYVGLATSLRSRLRSHLRDKHKGKWDRFSIFLTINHVYIKELESLILRIADPAGNSAKGTFAKAENLNKRFRNDILEIRKDELDHLLGTREPSKSKESRNDRKSSNTILGRAGIGKMKIQAKFKGKTYRAYVLSDGRVRCNKQIYSSLSNAGSAITNKPTNGWVFWKYLRGPGDWVEMRNLRK